MTEQHPSIEIRQATPNDAQPIGELFYESVHTVCMHDYAPSQLDAWAPAGRPTAWWQDRQQTHLTWVAEYGSKIVGFIELKPDQHYLDCLYVHRAFQNRGIATRLLAILIEHARSLQIEQLQVDVSITALPFFKARGFTIVCKQTVTVRNQSLINYRMTRRVDIKAECGRTSTDIDMPEAYTF